MVFVTEGMRKDFLRKYPKENAFVTIRNAFDAEDFKVQPGQHLSKDRFNIVYTWMAAIGEPSHNPDTFFEGVRKAVTKNDDLRGICVLLSWVLWIRRATLVRGHRYIVERYDQQIAIEQLVDTL